MREFDENTITEAVIERVAQAPSPRARQISEALVRHLHAFIREIRPTEAEWAAGIAFLTATGQKCDDKRQEFILLSDTLGVSTLVDSINNPVSGNITETTVFGPFYVPPPSFPLGGDLGGTLGGPPMYISGTVSDSSGKPLAGAQVDVWHSDVEGFYDVQQLEKTGGLTGRGRIIADAEGKFHFWTRRPAAYPIPTDGPVGDMLRAQNRHPWRPEHVHFMVQAPGHRKLVTHIFAQGDEFLGSDVVFGVKESLIRPYEKHEGGTAPDGKPMTGEWVSMSCALVLAKESELVE
jgi:hydroxyquinol 1,2-dioxygenase